MARNQGKDYGYYDFATKYRVGFAPLPAFRHLTPEEYQEKVAELIWEIEEQGRKDRGGDSVAGRAKILSQNPYERPTRKTRHTPPSIPQGTKLGEAAVPRRLERGAQGP